MVDKTEADVEQDKRFDDLEFFNKKLGETVTQLQNQVSKLQKAFDTQSVQLKPVINFVEFFKRQQP